MSFDFSVKADVRDVTRMLNKVERKVVPQAASTALNKTARQVNTKISRHISATSGIKVGEVKKRIQLLKASKNRLASSLWARGGRVPIDQLKGARQTKTGVRYNRGDGRKSTRRHAFMHNGKAFRRKSLGGGKLVARLPIERQKGPSVPLEFIRNESERIMRATAGPAWQRNFQHELTRRLARARL